MLVVLCTSSNLRPVTAQTAEPREGFHRVSGKHLEIVTDLPLDADVRQLPLVFDKAIPIWCKVFNVDLSVTNDWRVTAFIMLDKTRFTSAGLIPEHLPDFPYGYQWGDDLWVIEQPSAYYRRHLLLHEGTHWFMNRFFGSGGPPWVMEGMAEWLSTHRWDSDAELLEMAIIPDNRDELPYWGRITRIQEQLHQGSAPSIEDIMRYGNTAHQQVDAYAWSWAAVLFMQSHPDYQPSFQAMLLEPMRGDLRQTKWLFNRLRAQWPRLREEWNAFVGDLEYGFEPSGGMMRLTHDPRQLSSEPTVLEIATNRSWQASGFKVAAGQTVRVEATGDYCVAKTSKPWLCKPDGLTLEYYRGEPLGKLMMTIARPHMTEFPSQPLEIIAAGASTVITAPHPGELHFRINEASNQLGDNSGRVRITVIAN